MPDEKVIARRRASGAETNERFGRLPRGLQFEAACRFTELRYGAMAKSGDRVASAVSPQGGGRGPPPACCRRSGEVESEFVEAASPRVCPTRVREASLPANRRTLRAPQRRRS